MRARRLIPAAALAPAALGLLVGWAAPAGADAPTRVGWWNEANTGAVAPPAPPSVPSDGLYAANGPGGPAAVSGLEFTVPSGDTPGAMTLQIAGSPVITQPPVACPITGSGFTPAQNGAWADRPTWDCTHQVTGSVNTAQTAVSFDTSQLASGSTVAVVVLAGGPADQIAFSKPGPDTLAVGPSAGGSGAGATTLSPGTDTGSAGAGASTADGSQGASSAPPPPIASAFATGDTGGLAALPAPEASGAAAAPAAAAPTVGGPGSKPQAYAASRSYAGTAATRSGFPRSRVATALGLAAMLLGLAAYTQGYGILGGRIQPLSVRREPRPPRPA